MPYLAHLPEIIRVPEVRKICKKAFDNPTYWEENHLAFYYRGSNLSIMLQNGGPSIQLRLTTPTVSKMMKMCYK